MYVIQWHQAVISCALPTQDMEPGVVQMAIVGVPTHNM